MDSILIDTTSDPFIRQWQRLISTTNWDKGKIICQWREALSGEGQERHHWSDEAWSQRVGGVTPQHVGRLRRVYERFGVVRQQYEGLYWSHFQAAIDWNDAEMWLEGAVQNAWSISQMRQQRWQALGSPNDLAPRDEDVVESEIDEDAPQLDSVGGAHSNGASLGVVHSPRQIGESDYVEVRPSDRPLDADTPGAERQFAEATVPIRPFADLPSLPADVSEAFEAFKLCILRHKLALWQEITRDDLLASLDALKELALAPAAS